ncbi:STAS domain-containing protein [Streptomyces camponoticapitis]|uniref:STAS domain-containing protein n=1 Tax=Streptomyces camponoticapitis TaxID=1616125 RepID=UPI001662AB84|nr:STAS domain-containing protein [Streptomyces camponoticapitis]
MEATKTILLALRGPITAADVPQLCDQLAARLRDSGATDAVCDVGELGRPTVATVNALARLQLVARGHGCRIRLRDAGPELLLLLELVGLTDVIRSDQPRGGSVETGPDPPGGCPVDQACEIGRTPPTPRPVARLSPAAPGDRTAGTNAPCPGTS